MRHLLIALSLLLGALAPAAQAQNRISIGIESPGVSIGINMPGYPQLVRVPNYPVYYAPQANSNYFFYDGLYWVYQDDNWYSSGWYNGPWRSVEPDYVPLYVLRVPVRYYRQPPSYFRAWRSDQPPRWNEHWGRDWSDRRAGWDRWDRRAVPAPAPRPTYQRPYAGERYPSAVERQHEIRTQQYRYVPREPIAREQYRAPEQRRDARGNDGNNGKGNNGRGNDDRGNKKDKRDKNDEKGQK